MRRRFGCCQPCVVETTSWFPEETNPLQTKFCVICRRSFSEFAVTRTFTDLSSVGSVEIHQIFFRGESLVLQSWRRITVEVIRFFWGGLTSLNAAVGCCQRFVIEAASVLTEILSYQNLFVVSPMVRSINYFWVLPTLSIRVKGKRFTSECWIVSRFSVRWSSSSTIRTLMAWRSNIPQKSFLCERLFIPS